MQSAHPIPQWDVVVSAQVADASSLFQGAAMTVKCGVQVSLPGNRRRVARGVNAYETFRQKMVQRFDADYLMKARDHRSAGATRRRGGCWLC